MRERGQILVLFAISVTVLLIVAALAFDTGMMLVERRDQQNAADAAALAGARYLITNPTRAESDAYAMAARNGFADSDDVNVYVHIPPAHGLFRGLPGFIEVQIEASRSSIFGSVVGRTAWGIGAYAVAANQHGLRFGFGMLALNETACKAIHVSGSGHIYSAASIQSNSSGADCDKPPPYGFSRTGTSDIEIDVDAVDAVCRTVGAIQNQGKGEMTCDRVEYSFPLPDPLMGLPPVPMPEPADAMAPLGHAQPPPSNCPGAAIPPDEDNPQLCDVGGNGAAYADLSWILYPGLYPGGLQVSNGATAYLMPGIYWLGGGGFTTTTRGSVISVETEADAVTASWGGGVLIYNSTLPASVGPTDISLGGSGATLELLPLAAPAGSQEATYNGIVVFQARDVTSTVTLNGSDSVATVRGIVYVPEGEVKLNGNEGTLTVDQIIADTFLIDGNKGTINVMRERGVDVVVSGVGLVE